MFNNKVNRIFREKFGFLLLLVVFFSSCEAELEKAPLDQFSSESFWQDENDALLALTGVYRGNMRINGTSNGINDWWSYTGLMWIDLATDNGFDRRGVNSPVHKLTDGTNTATNGFVNSAWESSYQKIARSNDFLQNITEVPMEESKIARFSAEARAIRAWQYFNLAQYFGDVPLVTGPITVEEANTITRTPKDEVMQFVIEELRAAANAPLPTHAELPDGEVGRLTKQAVLAFLGRALMAEKKFSEAAVVYEEIVELGENIIDPEFESLFWEEGENSDEIIFAGQYVGDEAANAMYQHVFPAVLGGWHFMNPLADLVSAYQFDDGTPFSYSDPRYDPTNEAANRDPRLDYTIIFNGEMLGDTGRRYIVHPDSTSSPDQLGAGKQATQSGYGIQKRMDFNFSDLRNSGANMAVIRYAEVLLSLLEAKLEAGEVIDQALLDATINKVRGRASVNMPPITETDPNKLREILRNERRVELAFEGIRYWDLLRWGTADTELSGDFYGAPFPTADNLQTKDGQPDPYDRWYVMTRNFRPEVDFLWPIPQGEVSINPNLEQNPGY